MGRFGTWEIVIIAVIALVVFGGKRLPELGRGLGKGIANFRDSIKGLGGENSVSSEGFEAKPASSSATEERQA